MRAIILAAGQGTRLRPYTDTKPKGMVELAGESLLARQVRVLRRCGIERIGIATGYLDHVIDFAGVEKFHNPRYAETNMVATLFCAHEFMQESEDLFICYGDIVYEPRVLQALMASGAPLTITADREWLRYWSLRMDDPLDDVETFRMTDDGRVLELGKKPDNPAEVEAQYMGLIKVSASHVAAFVDEYRRMDRSARYDGKDFDNMFMTSFLQHLVDAGWHMQAVLVDNGWLEVDTVDDLDTYHRFHATGELKAFCDLEKC